MNRITGAEIAELCQSVYADNVAAGWWSDLTTGQRIDRNVGELLMLIVTELSEAAGGLAHNLMDDKLPHRQMIEVELADTAIRIFDFGGGLAIASTLAKRFDAARQHPVVLRESFAGAYTPNDYLLRIIGYVSETMERHRKGQTMVMSASLALALHGIFILGEILELDVMGAVVEKRAFNKTRADHQIENRRSEGGKKC